MNKNMVIIVLVVFALIGSIWGSVANKKKINLEKQLGETVARLQQLTELSGKEREQVLGKTVGLQESLAEKENQLLKARKELVALRKSSQAIESQLSGCTSSLQAAKKKKKKFQQRLKASEKKIVELTAIIKKQADQAASLKLDSQESGNAQAEEQVAAPKDSEKVRSLQDQLQSASLDIDQQQQGIDACNAQIIGLEKMLEEKNAAMEETAREMDRLKINMDVLLSKIGEQQDSLQEMQEENRELVKELAAKNEEIADLQEDVMQQPVQQE
jgi:chromosome segregation ATPase